MAITCNLSFRKDLDKALDDLFLPDVPPSTPRKRSSLPPLPLKRPITPPHSEYARMNSQPSSPAANTTRSIPVLQSVNDKRIRDEDYAFMEEIDLLEGLDIG